MRSVADSGQISEASGRQRNRRGVSDSRTRRSAVAAATMEGTPSDADRGARAYRLSTPGPAAIDSAAGPRPCVPCAVPRFLGAGNGTQTTAIAFRTGFSVENPPCEDVVQIRKGKSNGHRWRFRAVGRRG